MAFFSSEFIPKNIFFNKCPLRVKNIDFCSFSSKNHFFSFFLYSRNKNWWFFNFWKFWKNIFFSFCWNAIYKAIYWLFKKNPVKSSEKSWKNQKNSFFKNSKTRDSNQKIDFFDCFSIFKNFWIFFTFFSKFKGILKKIEKKSQKFWKLKKNQKKSIFWLLSRFFEFLKKYTKNVFLSKFLIIHQDFFIKISKKYKKTF